MDPAGKQGMDVSESGKGKRASIRLKKRKERKQPLRPVLQGAIKKKAKSKAALRSPKKASEKAERAANLMDKQLQRLEKNASKKNRQQKLKSLY